MSIKTRIWKLIVTTYSTYLRKRYGNDIGKDCVIHWSAGLDRTIAPKKVHIGDRTWILRDVIIISHDHCRGLIKDTYIGSDCVIGLRSIIMPGVTIGNQVVIGGGSVVTTDIPSNCIAVGNPAKVIKKDISVFNGKIISDISIE